MAVIFLYCEGGEDASGVLVGRLKPFKRGKHVMWWEKGDEMKDHDDGGKCNMEENINDQTKACRTKVDGEYYKEQPQKRTKKKVDSKTGREKEMDGKREVLSKENESKENRKIKGKDIVCDEVKAKVGQEIRMESECETTEDNRKEKIHEKTESDFAEEEFEGKETYRKKMNKTTHKRVGSESEQKERNEDIGEKGKALKRKLDNNSSCCEYVIKSNQKRTRDIAKSVEKDPKLMEFGLEDEESKQNSMISKTKERKKKKQTAESSTVELAASNTEKTKHDSSCSKNSKQSALDGAGEVKSSKVDKNGGNVQQQSSVSMESENSKTRKKAPSAIPREILQKSIPVDSTQVENEKECASQNEKVKKRRKQKKETSLKESNGLGFHDAQDLNHESTVSKEIRKTRKNEITEISRGKDNELVIYNTEVRGTTDENERISSEELVVCKRDEKTKKRKKGRAIGLDDKKDASVLDKTQVLPGESALGRKKEDNREEAGLTRTEKAKKRKPQSKKCSLENGIDLVIDNKPESSQKTEKCEGRSQESTVSINVKTAKEKKKEGMKIEEKNKEKLLSRSRAEKSEIPEQTDGQEQCTKQESSGIKGTKRKTRREKVEPVSKEKSKGVATN